MPADPDKIDERARILLSARADQFHEALRRGAPLDWDEFVGDLTGSVREAVLIELVHIDLEHGAKAGRSPRLEDYLDRFPEIGPAKRLPPELVLEECRARFSAGETPTVAEYQSRFPEQYEKVRDGLESLAKKSGPKPPSGVHPLESGVTVSKQYELVRTLGRGVFGEVWLAKKNPSGIEKAIKILLQPMDMDGARRELRSLELIKNLRHPYLLATEDFWVSEGRLHIAMELADSTVKQRLKSCLAVGMAALPVEEALRYTMESAEGLDYLHEHKVFHRDVKPDNILLLRGHAKVADFGLARGQDQAMASMTFAGTPAYMAPEVWGGEGGPASDQYSLALVYTELRQGRSPLKTGPMAEMMLAHLDGKFDFADSIGEDERRVLRKALAKEPRDRHASCQEFAEALGEALGRQPRSMARSGPVKAVSREPVGSVVDESTSTYAPVGSVVMDRPAKTAVPLRRAPTGSSKKKLIAVAVALLLFGGLATALVVSLSGTTGSTAATPETEPTKAIIVTTTAADGPPTVPTKTPPTKTPPTKTPSTVREIQLYDGRLAPEWIAKTANGVEARFRLLTPPAPAKPFYILQSKVWNALCGAKNAPPDLPAMNATRIEAEELAAQLGGRLPSPEEWDFAAGSLTRAGGSPWVNQPQPRATHGETMPLDVNDFDLIDMAGNGWEWTSGTIDLPGGRKKAILRGRNFTFAKPLTPALLKDERASPFTQYPDKGSPYTGFRVVVPLP